jgi:hypothetical protein
MAKMIVTVIRDSYESQVMITFALPCVNVHE